MKQQSPMLRLWELGEGQQGGLKRAVLSAVVGYRHHLRRRRKL